MPLTRGDGATTFGNALTELKQRGCNLLVTGALPGRVLTDVSASMLGRPPKLRARLFALVGRDAAEARRRLQLAGPSLEPAIVVDTVEHPRAAAAGQQLPADEPGIRIRRIERDLQVLEGAVRQAISEAKTEHYPMEPAELRLCVDSLWSLTSAYDTDEIRSFLTTVGDDVESVGGMAHYVLPAEQDDDLLTALEPCFDAVVEHRGSDPEFEQRWRLPEFDVTTPWMRL